MFLRKAAKTALSGVKKAVGTGLQTAGAAIDEIHRLKEDIKPIAIKASDYADRANAFVKKASGGTSLSDYAREYSGGLYDPKLIKKTASQVDKRVDQAYQLKGNIEDVGKSIKKDDIAGFKAAVKDTYETGKDIYKNRRVRPAEERAFQLRTSRLKDAIAQRKNMY